MSHRPIDGSPNWSAGMIVLVIAACLPIVACLLAAPLFLFLLLRGETAASIAASQITIEHDADGKPIPALQISAPPAPGATHENLDLKSLDARMLSSAAHLFYEEGDYTTAVQFQHWAIEKGDNSVYNMACYCGLEGDVDAALYWLQRAAMQEGVDAGWAERDRDLQLVWQDGRWPAALAYLRAANKYWREHGPQQTVLVLPTGYQNDRQIPVMVGLHGLGDNPDNFVDGYQEFADARGIAFIGVSGTYPRGPESFVWAEQPAVDAQRVEQALHEASDRLMADPAQVILFGFSQGAQVAAELCARHPDKYAGAIVLSPGGDQSRLSEVEPHSLLKTRGYVFVCGAGEHPRTVDFTAKDANWFRQAGARVIHKPYPDLNRHTFPPDYGTQLPQWIDFILSSDVAQ